MNLPIDLISQFAKATKSEKSIKTETTVYGTVAHQNGGTYIKFDGSDLLTPVTTTVEMRDGERVAVLLKNHTATVIGNISSPAVGNETVVEVENQLDSKLTADGFITNEEIDAIMDAE